MVDPLNLRPSEKDGLALLALIVIMSGIFLFLVSFSPNTSVGLVGGSAFAPPSSGANCPVLQDNSCPVQGLGVASTQSEAERLALQDCASAQNNCVLVEDHEHFYNATHCPTNCAYTDAQLTQRVCALQLCEQVSENGLALIRCVAAGLYEYSGYACNVS